MEENNNFFELEEDVIVLDNDNFIKNKRNNHFSKFKRSIQKFYQEKSFWAGFLSSIFVFILLIIISIGTVWYFRANIFGHFAKEYLKESQEVSNAKIATEKIIEKQSILSQQSLVVDTVKRSNPAVVSIVISKNVPKYEIYNDPNAGQYNPFGDMFGFGMPNMFFNTPQYRQNGTEKKEIGGGSGFLVSADGLIVTNKHVVDQKDVEYTVFTNDGKRHTAKVIARDPVLDIALIKINGSSYPYLSLGNSDGLQVGQSVIAIGNALGEFRNTVSVGVVSGLARSITAGDGLGKTESLDKVIQTDAAINPGNSGGPLLNLSGEVIGVNVAVAQGSQNVGFALPINSVSGVVDSVKTTGKIVRPYLGIRYIPINSEIKNKNNLSVDYGVLVQRGQSQSDLAVIPGSPADKAGIIENDIILEVDGVKLDDNITLSSLVRQKKVGDIVNLKILHRGSEKNIQVTLEAAKDN